MSNRFKFLRSKLLQLSALVFFVYSLAGFLNYGFVASDEYWDAITRYIPAQTSGLQKLVTPEDVKSPLQILPMHIISQAALLVGITHPFIQYRSVIVFWSVTGIIICLLAMLWLIKEKVFLTNSARAYWAIGLLGFHFAMPGIMTRPMFESLAEPWILLLAAAALVYEYKGSRIALLTGVFAGSLAFMLRNQTGPSALVMIILPFIKLFDLRQVKDRSARKRIWMDLGWASLLGLIFFILLGIPDYYLRGRFHFSLFELITYNLKHGSEYIQQPWYYFFPLIFIFLFGPWFIYKKSANFWPTQLKIYSLNIILGIFLIEHMAFANKWERFLFPMFPVLCLMLVPFLEDLTQNFAQRKRRLISLLVFNFMIWPISTFSPAQKNIIDIALYLDQNPQFRTVYAFDNSMTWIPDVFIRLGPPRIEAIGEKDLPALKAQAMLMSNHEPCSSLILVRKHSFEKFPLLFEDFRKIREFSVNIFDQLSYTFNPERNERRSPLVALTMQKCEINEIHN